MRRDAILATAAGLIDGERAAQNGDALATHQRIAGMWSAYLGVPVGPVDAAAMMALLKVARVRVNPAHADNWIDLAGYAALGGEMACAAASEIAAKNHEQPATHQGE